MARLRIPQPYEDGLIKLRCLQEDSVRELMTALAETSPVFEPQKLVDSLAPKVSTIPEADIRQILETLMSLFRAQTYLDLSTAELAEYVCGAMQESENESLRLRDEECAPFQKRLSDFFAIESLTYPAKVTGVVSDHDHVFVNARVLTDLRPIFGPKVEEPPKGAAIVHMLNIAYQQGRKREKVYIALDGQDIRTLISTLQRALSKEESLKQFLDATAVAYVKPE